MSIYYQRLSHKRGATVDLVSPKKQLRRTRSLDVSNTYLSPPPPTPTMETQNSKGYIDTSCPYRVAAPTPLALSSDWEPVNSIPHWDLVEFRQIVGQTLEAANVVFYSLRLIKRFRLGTGSKDVPTTLLIESDISIDDQYSCWKSAVESLRQLLDSMRLEQVLIEIIDSKATFSLPTRPLLECTSELFTSWQGFIPVLLEEIKEQKWLAIDVVVREFGIKSPFTVPTVLITTKDPDAKIWRQSIIPRLQTHLPQGMHIDLLFGSALSYAASRDRTDDNATEEDSAEGSGWEETYCTIGDYFGQVEIGSSIGVENSANSATLGALVKLCDDEGRETTCGLTNHHVISPEGSLVKAHNCLGQFLSPDSELCQDGLVTVFSPSHDDHRRLLKSISQDRARREARVQELADLHRHESLEYITKHRLLEGLTADWNLLDQNPNRLFGTVLASSGFRVIGNTDYTTTQRKAFSRVRRNSTDSSSLRDPINGRTLNFGLNWALIKLAAEREISDYAFSTPSCIKIPTSARVRQYTRIQENQSYNVAKKGRTTKWTAGNIGRIGSILKLRDDDINIVPEDLRHRFGDIDGIVLAFGVFNETRKKDFMQGGDSGSCVLLNENNLNATIVGLLFASNEFSEVSYMMPMDMVVRDIEYVTGQKVLQPTFVEYNKRFSGV